MSTNHTADAPVPESVEEFASGVWQKPVIDMVRIADVTEGKGAAVTEGGTTRSAS